MPISDPVQIISQKSLSIPGESTIHTITLEVTDIDGHKSTHSIDVAVLNPQ